MTDTEYMNRALELAARGEGAVEPNPMVGAVVVREDRIVGEGWHQKYGGPHAEVFALDQAGPLAMGATLYVTLEPCCHFGKTPPCTEKIIRSGVRRVVAAMLDPFPSVSGKGVSRLRETGIVVEVGVGEIASCSLNAPYLKRLRENRPWIIAKWAMTLDGKISTRSNESKWITNELARHQAHRVRGNMDAILIGAGTLRSDDPALTARLPDSQSPNRVATRVVVTSQPAQLPLSCQLFRTAEQVPTWVVYPESPSSSSWVPPPFVRAVPLPATSSGRVDLSALLDEMGKMRWTNVLVEGGAGLLGSFFDAQSVDEVHVYLAPKILGGDQAPSPVGGLGIEKISEALMLDSPNVISLGDNLLLKGRIQRKNSQSICRSNG